MSLVPILMAATLAAASPASAPAVVTAQIGSLKPVARFAQLPQPIVAGHFSVGGTSAAGWQMAEPGGAFSATDVPVSGAPGRRMIFAGCNAQLCLIHYERGGIAHFYEILAFAPGSNGWTVAWNACGVTRIAGMAALRALLAHPASFDTWSRPCVKGDF